MIPFELEIGCPQCGGTNIWLEYQRMNHCTFCGSLLCAEWKSDSFFYVPPIVSNIKELRNSLLISLAERSRADAISRYPLHGSETPPEMLSVITEPLAPYIEALKPKLKILTAKMLLVPYWHHQAVVQQSLLTTAERGTKQYYYRRAIVDNTASAYDSERWNFRDRGLRFKEARLKEATHAIFKSIPHLSIAEDTRYQSLRLKVPQDDQQYMFKFHHFAMEKRLGVFRPYWIVQYECKKSESVIVDGVFGTIAGHPTADEAQQLLKYSDKPYAKTKSAIAHVVPSRCGVCGADTHWKPAEMIYLCQNCGRAIAIKSGKLHHEKYLYEYDSRECIYAPFWRFVISLEYHGKKFRSLREYFSMFFPEKILKTHVSANHLWIPAFSTRRGAKGDQMNAAFIASASVKLHELHQGPIQPAPRVVSATLDSAAASELLTPSLPSAAGVPAAHLRSGILRPMLKETFIHVSQKTLVLLPFPLAGSEIHIEGKRFAIQFMEAA